MKLKLKIKSGFTLVETLVAISILSLSILATFASVQNGLQSSGIAKDRITAYYLAQEVMEYIKNIRDENAINSLSGVTVNWLAGLSAVTTDACWYGGSGVSQKTCTVDPSLKTVATCSGGFGTCSYLRQDATTGLYGYTGSWTATNIKREVQLTSLSANEVKVTINITWVSRGQSQTFQISQLLLNRQ